MEQVFLREGFAPSFEEASPRFQLDAAVAEYAELLRDSYWAQEGSLREVNALARRVQNLLPQDADVAEFVQLAGQAEKLAAD